MSGHQYATIEDTVYFWFGANDTSGSGGDGASPVFDVREAGAAAGAAPLLSDTATLLTDAGYPDGCHEIAVAATTGNSFAANMTFAVFCTLLIDSQNPTGFVGSCTLTPIGTEAKQDSIIAAVITNAQGADVATDVAGMIDGNSRVDVGSWLGTAVTLGNSLPDINVDSIDDTAIAGIATAGKLHVFDDAGASIPTAGENQSGLAPANEYDTQLDVNMSTRATSAKQDTMETTLNDVPTTSEFEARTIVSADYVVVGDTIARVTLVDTVTTNSDLVTAAAVKTAMEADNGDLDALMKGLINKRIWKEEDDGPGDAGDLEMHNDAGGSIGTVEVQVDTDGSFTTAKRAFQAV